ncbi:S1 RNA-binding domain-containing protein [Shigella boydii]
MEVKGIVNNLTDYGAFVDMGGVDGLLHITDMAGNVFNIQRNRQRW